MKNNKTQKNEAHKVVIGKEKRVGNIITTPINDGLFFMEDFLRLPKNSYIYIKKGLLMRKIK